MNVSKRLSVWEYGSEVVAAIFVYALLSLTMGQAALTQWVPDRKTDVINMLGLLLVATGFCFAAFIAVLCVDFGAKLRKFGQAKLYAAAFATPPIALIVTIIVFEFVSRDTTLSKIALVLAIYCVLSTITMFKNIIDLVGLWQAVEKARVTRTHQKRE